MQFEIELTGLQMRQRKEKAIDETGCRSFASHFLTDGS